MSISQIAQNIMESAAMKQALQTPLIAEWGDNGPAYRHAVQPQEVGQQLVREIHKRLVNARIGYLFREKIERNGHLIGGRASKVGAKLCFFAELDFLIEINWEQYKRASDIQRVALIDQQLCYCDVEDTPEGTRMVMHEPDLIEFRSIIQRWGVWNNPVRAMHGVMVQQTDLFANAEAPGEPATAGA
jgi:hypothetical protein